MINKHKQYKILQPNKNQFSFKNKSNNKSKQAIPLNILHKTKRKQFLFRSWLSFGFVLLLLIIVFIHDIYLQVTQHKKYELSSINNYIKIIPEAPKRGIITDRNGIGLAVNKLEYGVFITPTTLSKAKSYFTLLQQLIPLDDDDFKYYLKRRQNSVFRQPILLKNNLTPQEIARIEVNRYRLPDVKIAPVYTRYYPFGDALPHTLGYVGSINDRDKVYIENLPDREKTNYEGTNSIGKIGLEKFYESRLHGTVGYQTVEINSTGDVIKVIDSKEPIQGDNIRLSIDLPLQEYIKSLVVGQRAAIVVTNPKTSEVLAMVSNPGYDSNLFVNGISYKNYNELLNNLDKPLYNRTTMGVYAPGSTVKPFVSFSGLESGIITPNTTIFDPGYWTLPSTNQRYRDWKRGGHGNVDLHKAIVESVDTYFYELSYNLGIDNLAKLMNQFGFGNKTGIDITEESPGLFPTTAWKYKRYKIPWVAGDTPPVGIGQGYFTATPIQLVNALNTLINHGDMKQPHIALGTSIHGEHPQNPVDIVNLTFPDHKVFTDSPKYYWNNVLYAMYGVVNQTNGSGYTAFKGAPYKAAGKTGTAQVFDLHGENYNSKNIPKYLRDNSLFISFAPYKNPEISVIVIIEHGGAGSRVAAPIARKIIDYYLLTRLPQLDPKLSCSEQQQAAVNDLENLGIDVNTKHNVYNLKFLSTPGSVCKVDHLIDNNDDNKALLEDN